MKQPKKKPKKYNLAQLVLSEISLVDNPANQHARVSLWKAENIAATIETRIAELVKSGMSEVDAASQVAHELREQTGLTGDMDNPKEIETMDVKELEKKLGELEGQVAELTKERDTLKKSVEAAGFEVSIDDDGKITVEKGAEPEYIMIDGERVEKSTVPAPLLKSLEATQKRLAELETSQKRDVLIKRVNDELPNIAGTPAQKAYLIEAVDNIKDEADRKAVSEALKAADAAVSKIFETVGKAEEDEASPSFQLRKMAEEKAKEDGSSYEVAFAEVTKSGKGRELLLKSRTES